MGVAARDAPPTAEAWGVARPSCAGPEGPGRATARGAGPGGLDTKGCAAYRDARGCSAACGSVSARRGAGGWAPCGAEPM